MPGELQNQIGASNHRKPSVGRTRSIVVTQKLVMAIAERIYAMLMREMKIARERERFMLKSRPGQGGF